MGVVYHANYLVWMEVGRVELVRSLGINYHDLESREGLLLSVVEVECRYLAPAKYDQEVTVHTEIEDMNARLLRFKYIIQNAASGQLLTRGFTRHMWLNREFKPTKLPERYLEMLRGAFERGSQAALGSSGEVNAAPPRRALPAFTEEVR